MRKRPIGQILVEKNEISEAELAAALAEQERTGLRLGQILIETGPDLLACARPCDRGTGARHRGRPARADGSARGTAGTRARSPGPRSGAGCGMVSRADSGGSPCPASRSGGSPTSASCSGSSPGSPARSGRRAPPPAPAAPELIRDPEIKLHSVEALLKERQRAFIELVTTTETLRMKVAHLEEIIDERDRELTKLRVMRAS